LTQLNSEPQFLGDNNGCQLPDKSLQSQRGTMLPVMKLKQLKVSHFAGDLHQKLTITCRVFKDGVERQFFYLAL